MSKDPERYALGLWYNIFMLESRLLHYLILLAYSAVMAVALVQFKSLSVLTSFVLVVTPMVVLWRREQLHFHTVPLLALGAASMALLLSMVAHMQGAWYELSAGSLRLFGLVPLESFFVSIAHILFFVTIYEYFFDNAKNSPVVRHRKSYIIALWGVVATALGYLYLFSQVALTHTFVWIILLLLVLIGYAGLLLTKYRKEVILRSLKFTLAMVPFSLLYEYVALSNNLRFFANPNEYLYSFTIFEQIVPLEELIFILLLPTLVILYYELFFDDES